MVGKPIAGKEYRLWAWTEVQARPYAGDMARPTTRAKQLAVRLDARPSTVQGWLDDDFDAPQPLTPAAEVEHFQAVAEVMGQGRDAAVATLKLAAEGRATRRLRDVLRGIHESLSVELDGSADPADTLLASLNEMPELAPLWRSLVRAAAETGPPVEHDTAAAARKAQPLDAELLASAAMLPVAQVTVGEPVGDADLADSDLHRIAGAAAGAVNAALLSNVNAFSATVPVWLERASEDELVRAVQHARQCFDALRAIEPTLQATREEEYWRWVARFTPVADFLLKLIMPMIALLRVADGLAPTADTRRFLAAFDDDA